MQTGMPEADGISLMLVLSNPLAKALALGSTAVRLCRTAALKPWQPHLPVMSGQGVRESVLTACVQEGMRRPMLSPAEQYQFERPVMFLDVVPVVHLPAPQGPGRET